MHRPACCEKRNKKWDQRFCTAKAASENIAIESSNSNSSRDWYQTALRTADVGGEVRGRRPSAKTRHTHSEASKQPTNQLARVLRAEGGTKRTCVLFLSKTGSFTPGRSNQSTNQPATHPRTFKESATHPPHPPLPNPRTPLLDRPDTL